MDDTCPAKQVSGKPAAVEHQLSLIRTLLVWKAGFCGEAERLRCAMYAKSATYSAETNDIVPRIGS